ncbi:MAG: hypothetical protein IKM01_02695 [Clostridia bacterium]|nr:hypothetical protein [Clostridia bacterium]
MTVKNIVEKLNAKIYHIEDENREVASGYCGDFLSFVMGKAPADSVWFTVMANLNVCAVAVLCDVSVVVICEGVTPDDALVAKAKAQGVNLIGTDLTVYDAVVTTK